ncbi:MAG: hypothetical protein IJE72_05910 [Clostridia bacterium]|nr:hypothetical protein [Clostridia bacterium]
MKKITFYLILFSVSLLFFTSCELNSLLTIPNASTETGIISSEKEIPQETAVVLSTAKITSQTDFVDNNQGGAIIEARKYRVRYYSIPGPFADLVGRDKCREWELKYIHGVGLPENMLMVDFVKAFNISKEDFEKANLQLAKVLGKNNKLMMNPLDYTNQEIYEIFNADIIYTFDDQIINEYYLSHDYPYLYEHEYEEALANGTYQTRTTDWVNIEVMEAEIIAKYGEAEIVTESELPDESSTSESLPEETTTNLL